MKYHILAYFVQSIVLSTLLGAFAGTIGAPFWAVILGLTVNTVVILSILKRLETK